LATKRQYAPTRKERYIISQVHKIKLQKTRLFISILSKLPANFLSSNKPYLSLQNNYENGRTILIAELRTNYFFYFCCDCASDADDEITIFY
jgi:hypothetical protein